jgi:Flp pilus assembly protein TadD
MRANPARGTAQKRNGREAIVESRTRRAISRAGWTLLALASGLAARAATPEWRVLETPRFAVLSQLRDEETRAWAGQFDQFLGALGGLMPEDERARPPLTVVLFADEKNFEPYKPTGADGKHAPGVTGTFASRDSWSVVGMASRLEDRETREVIFHEGVHWHTSAEHRAQPVWYEEGLAEVFSTFRTEHGQAHWGEMPPTHVAFLKEATLFPLEKLLGVTREDPLFADHMSAGVFYAQSWALVHYLMFGPRADGREALANYLNATRSGATIEDACRTAFGCGCDELQRAVSAHLASGDQRVVERPLGATETLQSTVAPATPLVVESALARLAIGSGHIELAQQHCERAVELAPTQPAGYELFAGLAEECGDGDAIRTASGRAIELGSKDAAVFLALGQEEIRAAGASGEISATQARRVTDLFVHALALNPHLQLAYENFARALCSLDSATPQDLALLDQGRQFFPADGEIILGQAMLAANRGARTEAMGLLREALRPGVDLSNEGREAARQMAALFASEQPGSPNDGLARDALPAANAETAG